MNNTGIIIAIAYPDTIVHVAEEWYSVFLRFLGVGKKNYVRAGHAALVLIEKATGEFDYHDFGRYIIPTPYGRVRGKSTDHELNFPLKAVVEEGNVVNLDEILQFLATNPRLTHGEGKMVASVCNAVDYKKAKTYIVKMQEQHSIRYGAFIKEASNCARFVTDVLIASTTNNKIKKRLIKSKRFTPSTVGNVVIADTESSVYEVSELGEVSKFESSVRTENIRCFLDKLKDHQPSSLGNLDPLEVAHVHEEAQWLEGIGSGAWFELYSTSVPDEYRFRRISPHGNIDVDGLYRIDNTSFNFFESYTFTHHSNCSFYHIEQQQTIYRFDLIKKIN